jgi:hypothetical protein
LYSSGITAHLATKKPHQNTAASLFNLKPNIGVVKKEPLLMELYDF